MYKTTLFAFYILGLIMANILAYRVGTFFGVSIAGNPITYVSCFLICDVVNERWGLSESRKLVNVGLFASLGYLIFLYSTYLIPCDDAEMIVSFRKVFNNSWRVICASICAYFCSNHVDVMIFDFVRRHKGSKVARKVISTVISQFIDSTIFVAGAFCCVVEPSALVSIFIGEYLIKAGINLCETPLYCLLTAKKRGSK